MILNLIFNIFIFLIGVIAGASIVFKEAESKGYGGFVDVKGSNVKKWRWTHEMSDEQDETNER